MTDADVVKVPLAQLRRQLAERGYMADDSFRSKVRAAVVPMAFVGALGRVTRRRAKKRFRYLRPANAPAYTTYGPEAAAMGVAVFGRAALKRLDRGLAKAVSADKARARSRGDNSGGGDGCGGCGG